MNGKTLGIIGLAFAGSFGVGITIMEIINHKKAAKADQEFMERIQANNDKLADINNKMDALSDMIDESFEGTSELIEKMKESLNDSRQFRETLSEEE